jgi:hypothetical protein
MVTPRDGESKQGLECTPWVVTKIFSAGASPIQGRGGIALPLLLDILLDDRSAARRRSEIGRRPRNTVAIARGDVWPVRAKPSDVPLKALTSTETDSAGG